MKKIKGNLVMSKRNPIAKDLRTPKYAARVVKSKKVYSRKTKIKKGIEE